MSQKVLLLFGFVVSLTSEVIGEWLGAPYLLVALTILFFFLFLQEALLIQWAYRKENIEFTRRFNRRFPEFSNLARQSPNLFAAAGTLILFGYLDFKIELVTIQALFLTFFILKWVFDPLLGCFANHASRLLQPVFAYAVIYIYASTSALDSSIVEATPIPWSLSLSCGLFVFTILNMRMAYYQKFCFQADVSVEGQMNLVLLSLFLMSIPRVAQAMEFLSQGLR